MDLQVPSQQDNMKKNIKKTKREREEQKEKRGDKCTIVLEHECVWAGFDHLYKRLESRLFDRIVCDMINNSSRTGCTRNRREKG